MTNIEAMKLALDCLIMAKIQGRRGDCNAFIEEAIAALRQAISEAEQAEQEPVGFTSQHVVDWLSSGERTDGAYSGINLYKKPCGSSDVPLYTAPPKAEQEPVAEVKVRPLLGNESTPKVDIEWRTRPTAGFLYTAPPKHEWVSLTDDEIDRLWKLSGGLLNVFAKTYEAKLKELNT